MCLDLISRSYQKVKGQNDDTVRTYKRWIFCHLKLGTLVYTWYCMFCPLSSPVSSSCHQMVPSLHWMFQLGPWHPPVCGSEVMANPLLDEFWLTAMIISTVPYLPGWPLLSLFVFTLLFYILSLIFLVMPAASTLIALQMSSIGNSQAHFPLPAVCYKVCILKAFIPSFLPMVLSASLIVGTLTL